MGKSNYIKQLNKTKLYLEINNFIFYINETKINFIKSLYYKDEKSYSFKLTVKYIEKKFKFKRNFYKTLNTIKFIILLNNINRFKNKTNIKNL